MNLASVLGSKVRINFEDYYKILTVPGVGKVTAMAIMDTRSRVGNISLDLFKRMNLRNGDTLASAFDFEFDDDKKHEEESDASTRDTGAGPSSLIDLEGEEGEFYGRTLAAIDARVTSGPMVSSPLSTQDTKGSRPVEYPGRRSMDLRSPHSPGVKVSEDELLGYGTGDLGRREASVSAPTRSDCYGREDRSSLERRGSSPMRYARESRSAPSEYAPGHLRRQDLGDKVYDRVRPSPSSDYDCFSDTRTRTAQLPKSISYDGKGDWQAFLIKFRAFADKQHWNGRERLDNLCWALD